MNVESYITNALPSYSCVYSGSSGSKRWNSSRYGMFEDCPDVTKLAPAMVWTPYYIRQMIYSFKTTTVHPVRVICGFICFPTTSIVAGKGHKFLGISVQLLLCNLPPEEKQGKNRRSSFFRSNHGCRHQEWACTMYQSSMFPSYTTPPF